MEITRRRAATGAAWSVPAITIASAAPALAASPQPAVTGCFTLDYCSATRSGVQGYSGALAGTATNTSGNLSWSITQVRNGGLPQGPGTSTTVSPDPTHGDFATVYGSGNLGDNVYVYGGPGAEHWGGKTNTPLMTPSTAACYLLLNQGNKGSQLASETLTFDFGGLIPKSVSFSVYDQSRVSPPSQTYTDAITLSAPATISGTTALMNTTSPAAGQSFYRTGEYSSTTSQTYTTNISMTSIATSKFTLTYSNPTANTNQNYDWGQSQYIALGPITVCF